MKTRIYIVDNDTTKIDILMTWFGGLIQKMRDATPEITTSPLSDPDKYKDEPE